MKTRRNVKTQQKESLEVRRHKLDKLLEERRIRREREEQQGVCLTSEQRYQRYRQRHMEIIRLTQEQVRYRQYIKRNRHVLNPHEEMLKLKRLIDLVSAKYFELDDLSFADITHKSKNEKLNGIIRKAQDKFQLKRQKSKKYEEEKQGLDEIKQQLHECVVPRQTQTQAQQQDQ